MPMIRGRWWEITEHGVWLRQQSGVTVSVWNDGQGWTVSCSVVLVEDRGFPLVLATHVNEGETPDLEQALQIVREAMRALHEEVRNVCGG